MRTNLAKECLDQSIKSKENLTSKYLLPSFSNAQFQCWLILRTMTTIGDITRFCMIHLTLLSKNILENSNTKTLNFVFKQSLKMAVILKHWWGKRNIFMKMKYCTTLLKFSSGWTICTDVKLYIVTWSLRIYSLIKYQKG